LQFSAGDLRVVVGGRNLQANSFSKRINDDDDLRIVFLLLLQPELLKLAVLMSLL
jgi:hypothetical protein